MAYLDNSGSIILDAVLTDTGRMLLARGDGTFKVVKYSFFDDEINYTNFSGSHPSGSSYYDLTIMQTPVLEAFTNNMSYGRSKLMSIARTNLLYLPVMKLNELQPSTQREATAHSFVVAVDKDTEDSLPTGVTVLGGGVLFGENPANSDNLVQVDQGLDTTDISPAVPIDPDLVETQYIIEMDNRLGFLVSPQTHRRAAVSYVDDDYVASYFMSLADPGYVSENAETGATNQTIAGPRGTTIQLKIQSSLEINTSDSLFDLIGTTGTGTWSGYKYIDSIMRISGGTTGTTIDIPLRYLKKS